MRRTKNISIITGLIIFAVLAIPGPFKPSIWTYVHRLKLDKNLSSYSAPLYITPQTRISGVSFDTYLNWKDSYLIRGFADQKNHTGNYFYYQLAKNGSYGETSEGPSKSDMQPYREAIAMNCKHHDSGIHVCDIQNSEHHVAKLDVGNAYLVSDITKRVFNKAKLDYKKYPLPYDYYPPDEKSINTIAKLFLSTEPKPLEQVRKYFKPEF